MTGAAGAWKRSRPARFLITGGGTGGHVYPGIAVAEAVTELAPDAEIRFAGTSGGLEARLVPEAGYPLMTVRASGVRGLGLSAKVRFAGNFLAGFLRSLVIMISWRPDVVLGTGGYVSGPVLAAANILAVTCAIQEQNSVPGSANRLAARWAGRVYLGFAAAQRYFDPGTCVFTGNPVRGGFRRGDGIRVMDSGPKRRVLVFGGSRGARTLNRAAIEASPDLADRPDLEMWIQTGPDMFDEVAAAWPEAGTQGHRIVSYIQDMAAALDWADLVVSRAGAMTLAELQSMGKPAVLVPFPHATDDHQLENARDCEEADAAVVLPDAECTGSTLVTVMDALLADPGRLSAMAAAARSLARPEAARVIAADLLVLAGYSRA